MNKVKVVLNLLILLILLSLPIVAIFLLRYFSEWTNSLPTYMVWSIFIVIIAVFIFTLVAISKSKHFKKVFKEAFDWSQKDFYDYNNKNWNEAVQYNIDNNLYANKTKYYSQLNRVRGTILIILSIILVTILIILSGGFNFIVIFLILFTFGLIYNYFGRIIIISPEGIRSVSLFKNQFIKWESVKTIGVSVTGLGGKNNIDAFMLVYISSREINSDQYIIGGDAKGIITFKFRSKMIHHILAFYNNKIVNLHNIKRWRRYIKKLNDIRYIKETI